ncbi:hypothetical protein [Hymenobacter sp.]|jgi:hypothetical protein|uniref:pirin family protein n=1 Tax=Hymenobacter sp. TaxID=1898978 RepID=UPI002ED9CD04
MKQTPGKIFLADQRGLVETSTFRRYSTFNFGAYAHEHKQPFGSLYAVNEETLGSGQQLKFTAEQASYILLIPVTGDVLVTSSVGQTHLGVEQMQLLTVPANAIIQLTNPYETELVTFLHFWLEAGDAVAALECQTFDFQLSATENQLAAVVSSPTAGQALPFIVSLGRFAGREEVNYRLEKDASLFAFVLGGAFEVEGRLLHEKDGLALWDTEEVELEALSNNALVVVVELAKQLVPLGSSQT